MDEVILNNEVETENLINYGEEGITPNNPIEDDTLVLSSSDTVELLTSSDDSQVFAPDAITVDPVNEISTPSETGSTESASDNIDTNNYNIDDLYTLLNSGSLTVKIQSESEADQLQSESESELSISDIITQLEKNRITESECMQVINENIVKSSENEKTLSVMSITILVSILGGMVAIGFLKGLR